MVYPKILEGWMDTFKTTAAFAEHKLALQACEWNPPVDAGLCGCLSPEHRQVEQYKRLPQESVKESFMVVREVLKEPHFAPASALECLPRKFECHHAWSVLQGSLARGSDLYREDRQWCKGARK